MARIVESSTCPTCGQKHPSGTVQKFEIPEVPVVDATAVAALRGEIAALGASVRTAKPAELDLGRLDRGFKNIDESLGKLAQGLLGHPKPGDIIKEWESCPECQSIWAAVQKDIANKALKGQHTAFSDELLAHFGQCETCKPAFDKFKQQIAEDALKQAKETATPASEEKKGFWNR
ncbi:MAG: hypothetical protein CVV27_02630 [Candidatus Melainabacteria bacterium HGW-Melainabacteria-1]|nr:MAG: hypothetical protein CVV27_02630 [Candidatus Melainabacteria bacterium HGW-Melainabacteria-1]